MSTPLRGVLAFLPMMSLNSYIHVFINEFVNYLIRNIYINLQIQILQEVNMLLSFLTSLKTFTLIRKLKLLINKVSMQQNRLFAEPSYFFTHEDHQMCSSRDPYKYYYDQHTSINETVKSIKLSTPFQNNKYRTRLLQM